MRHVFLAAIFFLTSIWVTAQPSANDALRYSSYLKKFYERIKARRGAGKAIIATARRFLGIIYLTLKNKWVFADFPNFVLAEQ